MSRAERIIAELAAEHMPKPAHNLFARRAIRALRDQGILVVDTDDADHMKPALRLVEPARNPV